MSSRGEPEVEPGNRPSRAQRRAEELGERINGHPEQVADALHELPALLVGAGDDATTEAAVIALGHAQNDRATQVLLGADLTGHPSPQVRLAMAQALGGGVPDPEVRTGAITHLLRLSVDPAPEVRTRQVLEAPDARGVTLLHLQAAVELAGPGLLAVLNELSQEWTGDDDEHTARLARALTRSTPHAADRAAELEQQLAHGVNECLAGPDQGIYLTGSYPRTTLHFRNEPPQTGWWRRLWESEDPNTLDLPAEIATWSNGAGVNSDGDDAAPLTAQRDR